MFLPTNSRIRSNEGTRSITYSLSGNRQELSTLFAGRSDGNGELMSCRNDAENCNDSEKKFVFRDDESTESTRTPRHRAPIRLTDHVGLDPRNINGKSSGFSLGLCGHPGLCDCGQIDPSIFANLSPEDLDGWLDKAFDHKNAEDDPSSPATVEAEEGTMPQTTDNFNYDDGGEGHYFSSKVEELRGQITTIDESEKLWTDRSDSSSGFEEETGMNTKQTQENREDEGERDDYFSSVLQELSRRISTIGGSEKRSSDFLGSNSKPSDVPFEISIPKRGRPSNELSAVPLDRDFLCDTSCGANRKRRRVQRRTSVVQSPFVSGEDPFLPLPITPSKVSRPLPPRSEKPEPLFRCPSPLLANYMFGDHHRKRETPVTKYDAPKIAKENEIALALSWRANLSPLVAEKFHRLRNLAITMGKSQESQQNIHDWDRRMGLRRSHSKTMRASGRSRKKLQESMDLEACTYAMPPIQLKDCRAHCA